MAHLHIKPRRKDNKYPVQFCFINGKRINKLLTGELLKQELNGSNSVAATSQAIADQVIKHY